MSGFFKVVVKVVATAVGFAVGGPLGAAVASAAVTAATGGSFTDALIAAATTFAGAHIGQALSGSFESFATAGIGETVGGFTSVVDPITGLIDVIPTSSVISTVGDFLGPSISEAIASASQPAFNMFAEASSAFGAKSAFDVFNALSTTTLASLGGQLAGQFAGSTLEEVLQSPDLLGADEALLGAGFTIEGIAELRTEARKAQLQQVFERVVGIDVVPDGAEAVLGDTLIPEGVTADEFKQIIANGLLRRNVDLGEGITQIDFTSVFGGPGLGGAILGEEGDIRRDVFAGRIASSFEPFPGDLFNPMSDDDIIQLILGERQGPAAEQIGRSAARGNLNPLGGRTANQELLRQSGTAETRLQDIGGGVLTSNLRGLRDIRTRAEQSALQFQLGDPLFDIAPFETERSEFIGTRTEGLEADIRTALGGEALFNVPSAIQAGGRLQGVVSGPPPNRLLDVLAARESEAEAGRRGRRGLGVAGSGVF